ncbi:MAG: pyridoxal phosphate-dependent aminotransferase [Bdellovibrionota bacterium]
MVPEKVQESLTLALLGKVREMKARGEDVVSFAAGEPDFDTPPFIIEEATRSMKAGNTRYVASQGQLNLREAIASDYRERLNSKWVTPASIVVTGGAKQALYLLMDVIMEPGDEALIPVPYWVSYPSIVKSVSGVAKPLACQEKNGYFPTVAELEAAYTPKTKVLIFSSPGNPSGTMIQESVLKEIIEWCAKRKVYLLYDELYERLVLSPERKHISALALCDEAGSEYVFAINACSKTMAMTGWRLGWIAGHPENIKRLTAIQSQMVTCFPGFIQDAAAKGMKEAESFLKPIITAYSKRRDLIMKGISSIPGLKCIKPDGAFYLFVDATDVIKKKGLADDKAFAAGILEAERVVVVPGGSMGMKNWVRLSFATNEDEINKGIERFKRYCA